MVELKVDAQVMLTRNLSASRGLVNGSRGVVESFVGGALKLPVVRFVNVGTYVSPALRLCIAQLFAAECCMNGQFCNCCVAVISSGRFVQYLCTNQQTALCNLDFCCLQSIPGMLQQSWKLCSCSVLYAWLSPVSGLSGALHAFFICLKPSAAVLCPLLSSMLCLQSWQLSKIVAGMGLGSGSELVHLYACLGHAPVWCSRHQ